MITSLMLLLAMGPWPYGYYTVLRWLVCGVGIVFAIRGYNTARPWATWTFGFVAVLFNPIAPVSLTRSVWQPIDVLAALLLAVGSMVLTSASVKSSIGGHHD